VDYVTVIFDYGDQMLGRYNFDFACDEAAIVRARAMLPPRGGRLEVWQGRRHITTVASPNG
jgi:hypothetical protein